MLPCQQDLAKQFSLLLLAAVCCLGADNCASGEEAVRRRDKACIRDSPQRIEGYLMLCGPASGGGRWNFFGALRWAPMRNVAHRFPTDA